MPAALARLQTKYQLVVLSNGDPDMLETAQAISQGSVRPRDLRRRSQFLQAACGDLYQGRGTSWPKADQILFVANHAFDCIGAKSAGMRTAFIDRRSRPFGETPHQPDILVPSMKDLADAIV